MKVIPETVRTLTSDQDVRRYRHERADGKELIFQSQPKGHDLRIQAYFDAADIAIMRAAFTDDNVSGVTCETTLLAEIQDWTEYAGAGPDGELGELRAALEAALALVLEAMKEP